MSYSDVQIIFHHLDKSGGSRISQMGRGRQPLSLGRNLLFDKIYAENCMKMKEIGPGAVNLFWVQTQPIQLMATEF